MSWVYLILAGLSEVGMALSLKTSKGFTHFWPSVITIITGALSFGLLNLALKDLQIGIAYTVWTGIGAVGTTIIGMLFLSEAVSASKLIFLALIIIGVIGLQLTEGG